MKTEQLCVSMLASWFVACGGGPAEAPPATTPQPAPSAQPGASSAPAVLYQSAFKTNPPEKWTSILGNWWVKDGVYQQDDPRLQNTRTTLDLPDSDCYTFQFKARKIAGREGFLAIVKYQQKYVRWNIGGWNNTRSMVQGISNENETNRPDGVEPNRWYEIKLVVDGDRLTGWMGDVQKWNIRRTPEQVQGLSADDQLAGLVGLGTWSTHAQFSNVEVTAECP